MEEEISEISNATPDNLSKSVDYSANDVLTLEIKKEIDRLTSELASTQNQLEEVIIENNGLHRQVDKLQKDISTLKKMSRSSDFGVVPGISGKKRRSIQSEARLTPLETLPMLYSPEPKCTPTPKSVEKRTHLEIPIKALERELRIIRDQVTQLNIQLDKLSERFHCPNYNAGMDFYDPYTRSVEQFSTTQQINLMESSTPRLNCVVLAG